MPSWLSLVEPLRQSYWVNIVHFIRQSAFFNYLKTKKTQELFTTNFLRESLKELNCTCMQQEPYNSSPSTLGHELINHTLFVCNERKQGLFYHRAPDSPNNGEWLKNIFHSGDLSETMTMDKQMAEQEQSSRQASRSISLTQSPIRRGFMGWNLARCSSLCALPLYLRNRSVFQLCGDIVVQFWLNKKGRNTRMCKDNVLAHTYTTTSTHTHTPRWQILPPCSISICYCGPWYCKIHSEGSDGRGRNEEPRRSWLPT